MAAFEVGDLVKVRESGKIGRIISMRSKNSVSGEYAPLISTPSEDWVSEAKIQEPGSEFGYGISWHPFEDLEDVYEYEREAGHYGLTPKGITPPQEA